MLDRVPGVPREFFISAPPLPASLLLFLRAAGEDLGRYEATRALFTCTCIDDTSKDSCRQLRVTWPPTPAGMVVSEQNHLFPGLSLTAGGLGTRTQVGVLNRIKTLLSAGCGEDGILESGNVGDALCPPLGIRIHSSTLVVLLCSPQCPPNPPRTITAFVGKAVDGRENLFGDPRSFSLV